MVGQKYFKGGGTETGTKTSFCPWCPLVAGLEIELKFSKNIGIFPEMGISP